jgi:hypothetical protein
VQWESVTPASPTNLLQVQERLVEQADARRVNLLPMIMLLRPSPGAAASRRASHSASNSAGKPPAASPVAIRPRK